MPNWAPSQYPKRRLSVRSRKVSKPRDRYFKLSYRFEIWQAHRQHCCRSACQISERSDNSKYKSRGFETLRDLTERRLFGYWDGALGACAKTTHSDFSYICWWASMSNHIPYKNMHLVQQIYIRFKTCVCCHFFYKDTSYIQLVNNETWLFIIAAFGGHDWPAFWILTSLLKNELFITNSSRFIMLKNT